MLSFSLVAEALTGLIYHRPSGENSSFQFSSGYDSKIYSFLSQVHSKDFSDEENFTFVLELVTAKIRDQVRNLKLGTLGYNTAWQRLEKGVW